MALLIGDNFSYNGKKPNFERDSFETLVMLKTFAETNLDNGHIAYCKETNKHYVFNDTNSDDSITGKWRVLESEFTNKVDQSDLTAKLNEKEDKFTVGTGLELTEDRVLNVTLNTTVFKVVQTLPSQPEVEDEQKIHLVPLDSTSTQNLYAEYLWVNNDWEQLGEYKSNVDLSAYLTITDAQNIYQPKGDYAVKSEIPDISNLATKTELSAKQDALISGTNIKTINGTSLLGSGNIVIESSGGGSEIIDVLDNKTYARTQGSWVDLTDYLTWGEYD